MNERMTERNEEIEIDLHRLVKAVGNKSWLVGIVAVACALVAFLGTFFFVTPKYQSSVMFYINNSAVFPEEEAASITTGDISASRSLVKNYIIILNTRETLNDVIDYTGLDLTCSQLQDMISAEAVDSTEIIEVVVAGTNPAEAEQIADAIAYIMPRRISGIIEGTSATVIDFAVLPSRPSSPNYITNALIGFLLGMTVTAVIVVLRDLCDTTIRAEADLERSCRNPVLASVPDMLTPNRGVCRWGFCIRGKGTSEENRQPEVIGADISSAASEAYKLLRTKLQFSFADGNGCPVIGISSALPGEGKSVTAVNLAYVMSQLNCRVLLIDCDMRASSLAEKLSIQKTPGLADFLSGQSGFDDLIQPCGLKDNGQAFHVISAGRKPSNPMELLSSQPMEKRLALLRQNYDYIILDLPPVGEVADALAVSKLTDGMLLVVRHNYGNGPALSNAVRQLAFVKSRILGVVYNCTGKNENSGCYAAQIVRKNSYEMRNVL